MVKFDYDLFVIGGGSGGVRAARLAGNLGQKVGLAEEYRLGGTCVIRGCVPKKLFVYASHYADMFEDAKGFGWQVKEPQFHWKKLRDAKDQEIKRLEGLYAQGLENAGVEIHHERATFIDAHTLELSKSKKTIRAKKILIAAGARPNQDFKIEGIEHTLTTNELFDLETLPEKMVIVGGGYTAIEFANVFHGLGVDVTLVHWKDLILSRFDQDLSETLQNAMIEKGLHLEMGTVVNKIEREDGAYTVLLSNEKQLRVDQVVVAMGRVPYIDGLGLENADVKVNANGLIAVDRYMTTSVPHIWAIGDVANHYQLTPVAIHEAMCFIKTAFADTPTAPDYDYIATAVFSQPEIGKVGLSEEEAVEQYAELEIYKAVFRPMVQTLSGRNERMLMKLVVDYQTRRILGAHILGEGAGEMAQLLAISLKAGVTKDQFDATMAVHPTAAEELVTMYKPSYLYQNGQKVQVE